MVTETLEFYRTTKTGQRAIGRISFDGSDFVFTGEGERLVNILMQGVHKSDSLSIYEAMRKAPIRFDGAYLRAALIPYKPEDPFMLLGDIIDEEFALRLKQGGPKWERSTNAYEMTLRSEYDQWAQDTAKAIENAESEEDWRAELRDRVDDLIILLMLLGRRNLTNAFQLGLGEAPASPDGQRELAMAIEQNEDYLVNSLGPGIIDKVERRLQGEPDIRLDRVALAALFGTFIARVGSYAGAFWSTIHRGFGDVVRQLEQARRGAGAAPEEAKVPVYWARDPRAQHCNTCLAYGDQWYDSWDDMLALTGGIFPSNGTDCDGQCRCSVLGKPADDSIRTVWTHLAKEVGGMPPMGRSLLSDDEGEAYGDT